MDTISWINAHVNLFNFLGGVPKIIVPDNPKAVINKSNYYDPETNVTYHKMAIQLIFICQRLIELFQA